VLVLIAFIIGVCFLGAMSWSLIYNYYSYSTEDGFVRRLTQLAKDGKAHEIFYLESGEIDEAAIKAQAHKLWEEYGDEMKIKNDGMNIYGFICMPILIVSALLVNIFAWLKNGVKRTLIAAILYLIGLNIPSAVLCFIGFSKLKKANAG